VRVERAEPLVHPRRTALRRLSERWRASRIAVHDVRPDTPPMGTCPPPGASWGTCANTGDPQPFGNHEIRRREDGQMIGGVDFHEPADENGSVTIGYGIIPPARGKRYASEALRGLLLFARARGVTCATTTSSPSTSCWQPACGWPEKTNASSTSRSPGPTRRRLPTHAPSCRLRSSASRMWSARTTRLGRRRPCFQATAAEGHLVFPVRNLDLSQPCWCSTSAGGVLLMYQPSTRGPTRSDGQPAVSTAAS
jgi:hypothetical protein